LNASDLLDPEIFDEANRAPAQPRQRPNHSEPARRSKPAAEPPAREGGFLNAADLFDPDLFEQIEPPTASRSQAGQINAADLFDPDLFEQIEPPTASRSQAGQINAADLFDPELLSFSEPEEAPEEPGHFNASELLDEDLMDGQFGQGWGETDAPEDAGWDNAPRARPRAPSAPLRPPVGAPLLNLRPIVPEAPPRRPSRPGAARSASHPPAYTPDPLELEEEPLMDRGWRVIPSSPPPGAMQTISRPATQRRPPPAQPGIGRQIISGMGKAAAIALVLGILATAILVGYARCQQLNCWQTLISSRSTALPTTTPIPGFSSYQDTQLGLKFEYPQGWKHTNTSRPNDKHYQSDRFSASAYAWIEVGSSSQYNGSSPDQINEATINLLKAMPTVIFVQTWTPDTPTTHIDGQDWTIEDALITLQDNTTLQLTTLALLYNGRGYVIFYQSHQEEFSLFSSHYFEPMLLSFRFLDH
jgi:hypothetical protein